MATEAGLSNAIGCLSVVLPEFIALEIARLTDEIVSATQAITDPLAAIADTNVQGIVDDTAELASGSIVENLGDAVAGLVASYAKKDVQDRLDALALANPEEFKEIHKAQNVAEQVYASSMIMVSLFREAPYVAAQRMCEKVVSLSNLKLEQLKCLKKHVVQMSNSVTALAAAKNEIVNFGAELFQVQLKLEIAKRELSKASLKNADGSALIDSNALARGVSAIKDANGILAPEQSEISLLQITNVLLTGTDSGDHTTSANIKLASMVTPHLNFQISAEAHAVRRATEAINFQLESIFQVIDNFRISATKTKSSDIKARAISDLLSKVTLRTG